MKAHQGFTIVELLIVVVVIAILAAITIVSYNGITNRANDTAVQSDLSTMAKKTELTVVQSGEIPCYQTFTAACLNAANELKGISAGSYQSATSDALRYGFNGMSGRYEITARSKSGKIFAAKEGSVREAASNSIANGCTWAEWSSTTKLWTVISLPC